MKFELDQQALSRSDLVVWSQLEEEQQSLAKLGKSIIRGFEQN